jgi:hypothetical protein
MLAQELRTPGVYIIPENVLNDPARILRTGVPVFLGVLTRADLNACNERMPPEEQFEIFRLVPECGVSIVRRQAHLRLPARRYSPALDTQLGDPSSGQFGYQNLRAGAPMPAPSREASIPDASAGRCTHARTVKRGLNPRRCHGCGYSKAADHNRLAYVQHQAPALHAVAAV